MKNKRDLTDFRQVSLFGRDVTQEGSNTLPTVAYNQPFLNIWAAAEDRCAETVCIFSGGSLVDPPLI